MPADKMFRILVIDGDPSIHHDFRTIFAKDNEFVELAELEREIFGDSNLRPSSFPEFQVDFASIGSEGIQKIRLATKADFPYSIAFVDLRMQTSEIVLETIESAWAEMPELQIVICTACADVSWTETMSRLGWTDRLSILKKPFDKIVAYQMALAASARKIAVAHHRRKIESLQSLVSQKSEELELENKLRLRAETLLLENPDLLCDAEEVDEATGMMNRSAILSRIKDIAREANASHQPYSILFVDVDRMQTINEEFGTLAGDLVLKNVAQRLSETLRPSDVIGRYDGEEFIVGLRKCSQEDGLLVAERLRKRVADSSVVIDGQSVGITVSVGVSTQDATFHAVAEKVLSCADQALGLAKRKGRNRVESHGSLNAAIHQ